MKIALAQLNYLIGNIDFNKKKIIESIKKAITEKADLVVFAELSVCGYTPQDMLEQNHFIENSLSAVNEIAGHCKNIAAVVGAPGINLRGKGKRIHNSAYFLYDGKVQSVAHKALLPTYDVFDEYRYFESGTNFDVIEHKGTRIALTICEDLWGMTEHPLYVVCPMDELIQQKPDLILNIAASPFSYVQEKERKKILSRNARHYQLPLLYVNQIGTHTEVVFDGASLAMDKKGCQLAEMKSFEEDFQIFTLKKNDSFLEIKPQKNFIPEEKSPTEVIYEALILGIKDYFKKMGFSKAILGLSGGIDSALVLVLAEKALGKDSILPVLMPSEFSSKHSVDDSIELCKNLKIKYETLPISNAFHTFQNILKEPFKNTEFGLAEENLQARIRGVLLMAMSNKFGHILLNTTNKSEMAVGYGTLYGDMCGGISVLGDVYKTQVYELCKFINKDKEIIPKHILTKAPSAELRHGQKDSDSLPEYDILDKILFHYIEERKSKKEIVALGFSEETVMKTIRLVNLNEYKRYQAAPVLRISPKAFGVGRRMPIVAKFDI
jgi:NAD+ synthase (glutamine-hydrolysing)